MKRVKQQQLWGRPDGPQFWQEDWQLEDGTVLDRGRVRHPGAVVLVPLLGQQILMLRQYRFVLDETILECPAGTRHWQEDWRLCAQRELREETGYRAQQLEPLGNAWPAPGMTDELMQFYLAWDLVPDPLPQDIDEEISLQPYPLAELVLMALDGRLRDGKSVIGILRAAAFLNQLPHSVTFTPPEATN